MHNPDLYQESNAIHKRDSLQVLTEYSSNINWKKNSCSVIDIGCGDGSVTAQVLRKCTPANYSQVIGCDISENMIRHAQRHYGDDNTSFKVLDIKAEVPIELVGCFDHAFSFYALNWVLEQKKAFANIYHLLGEGGNCVLVILAFCPFFDIYRILSRSKKWSSHLGDPERFISPYHDPQEPEKVLSELMKRIGFKHVNVVHRPNIFVFKTLEAFRNLVASVNAFDIPTEMFEEYLDDFMALVRDGILKDLQINYDEAPPSITFKYNSLIAYGSK